MSDTTFQPNTGLSSIETTQNDAPSSSQQSSPAQAVEGRRTFAKSWRKTFAFPAYSGLLEIV